MSRERRLHQTEICRQIALSFVLASVISFIAPNTASSQPANAQVPGAPIQPPNSLLNWIPPNQAPPQLPPPPPGDGPNALPVIPGDKNAPPPPVPTGQADRTTGNWFPNQVGNDRTVVYIFRQSSAAQSFGQNRGTRMDMTIRPDQLSAQNLAAIQGILGVNLESGEPEIDVVATNAQIAQIQQVLYPYPQTQNQNGWQIINNDTPAPGYPKPGEQNSYNYQGPLPTVRTFCRYLVILGVVCATIFMALAAWSMVLGQPYGGSRVLGTATGFMLLLMGYTIWKIVQMNTFGAMSNLPPINQNRPTTAQVGANFVQPPDVPVVPAGQGRANPQRSGIPVQPLSNN